MTLNFLPVVGRSPDHPDYYYGIGYNGPGLAQATAMGPLLADLMLGRSNPWHEVICRKPAWLPPKPLRYVVVKSLLGVVNGVDRCVDRRIEAERIGRWPRRA